MCPHKFKMSLSFEYEGDDDEIKSIQAGVNNTLGNLVVLQKQMVDNKDGSTTIDPFTVVEKATDNASTDQKALPKTTRPKRPNGTGPLTLVVGLRGDSYFGDKRTIGDVVAQLAQQGHNFQ